MASKGMLALLCFAFFCTVSIGQNAAFGDLSAVKWKSSADFDNTILQEATRMDAALAQVNLQAADRALYLAYRQLVSYIKSDVQAGLTIDQVFQKRYDQVLTEAPNDPDTKYLIPGTLEGLLPGLLEGLMESPALIMGQ